MIEWLKVFHVLGLLFWMGTLLLASTTLAFYTHDVAEETARALARLQVQLLKGVGHLGAGLMIATGVVLVIITPSRLHQPWFHAKMFLVALLVVAHLIIYFRAKAIQAGRAQPRPGEWGILHGAVALLVFGILVLVLVKPF
ncbi:MAG: CopD family protein [Acidobacteria bacterium]|nr:CopD family protein [Acidobacteriota bacterium]